MESGQSVSLINRQYVFLGIWNHWNQPAIKSSQHVSQHVRHVRKKVHNQCCADSLLGSLQSTFWLNFHFLISLLPPLNHWTLTCFDMLGMLSSSSSSGHGHHEETTEDVNVLRRFANLLRMPARADLADQDWDLVPSEDEDEDEDFVRPPPPPAPPGLESFFPATPVPVAAALPPPSSSSAAPAAPAAPARPARRPAPKRRPRATRKMMWFYPHGTKMTLHCLPSEHKLVQELIQDYDVDFPPDGLPPGQWRSRMFSWLDCILSSPVHSIPFPFHYHLVCDVACIYFVFKGFGLGPLSLRSLIQKHPKTQNCPMIHGR